MNTNIPTAIKFDTLRIAYLHAYANGSADLNSARDAYAAAALLRCEYVPAPTAVGGHLAAACAAAGGAAYAMIDVFSHWANVAQQAAENLEGYAKHARAAANAAAAAAAASDCPADAVAAAEAEDYARRAEAWATEHSVPRVNARTWNLN